LTDNDLPPHDIAAEQTLLGACMTGNATLEAVRPLLPDPTAFFRPAHQTIYAALLHLTDAEAPADPIALADHLQTTRELTRVGDREYLFELYKAGSLTTNPTHHATIVTRHAQARRAQAAATRILQRIAEGTYDNPAELLQTARDDLDKALEETGPTTDTGPYADRIIGGGTFIFDAPDSPPAIWGSGQDVLWARGESLIVGGPPGVGKTTLVQQLVLATIGLRDNVLGYPIEQLDRILYLASDRPAQAQRSFSRMVTPDMRDTLDARLPIWKGPPPADVAKDTSILLKLAQAANADVIVLDSIKDMAIGLSEDDVGAAFNQAVQICLAAGIEVIGIHHPRKASQGNAREPLSVDEFYGSTWITAGAGSVISLYGVAGDPVVSFRHLKQPAVEVGPWRLKHDHQNGTTEIFHQVNVLDLLVHSKAAGITAKQLAQSLFPKDNGVNTESEVEKARRRLDGLVREELAVRRGGGGGRGKEATYHAAFTSSGELPFDHNM
jgi:replicative DNA helicase